MLKRSLIVLSVTAVIALALHLLLYWFESGRGDAVPGPGASFTMHHAMIMLPSEDLRLTAADSETGLPRFYFPLGMNDGTPAASALPPSAASPAWYAFTLFNFNYPELTLVADKDNPQIKHIRIVYSDGSQRSIDPVTASRSAFKPWQDWILWVDLPDTQNRPCTIYLQTATPSDSAFTLRIIDSSGLYPILAFGSQVPAMLAVFTFSLALLLTWLVIHGKFGQKRVIIAQYLNLLVTALMFLPLSSWLPDFPASAARPQSLVLLQLAIQGLWHQATAERFRDNPATSHIYLLPLLLAFGLAGLNLSGNLYPERTVWLLVLGFALVYQAMLWLSLVRSKPVGSQASLHLASSILPFWLYAGLAYRTASRPLIYSFQEHTKFLILLCGQSTLWFGSCAGQVWRRFRTQTREAEHQRLQIARLKKQLLERDRRVSTYLANPLSGIKQLVDLLTSDSAVQGQREELRILRQEMDGIVQFLSQLQHSSAGTARDEALLVTRQNLEMAIQASIRLVQYLAGDHPVQFVIKNSDFYLTSDFSVLQKLLANLIYREQIFHTIQRIEISSGIQGKTVQISIVNNGLQEFQPDHPTVSHLVPGTKAGSDDDAFRKMHLELTLRDTADTARRIGATVAYDYRPEGNRYLLTLPTAIDEADFTAVDTEKVAVTGQPATTAKQPLIQEDSGKASTRRMAIINDEPVSLFASKRVLERQGWTVQTYLDPEEALAVLAGIGDTMVLLVEAGMLQTTGFEFCRRLRASQGRLRMPIIMIINNPSAEQINAVFQSGANDYLVRPFSNTELQARISTHLELALSTERELEQTARMAEIEKTKTLSWLTAGLAHEIHTPNNAILRNIPLLHEIWTELCGAIEKLYKLEGSFNIRGFSYEELQNEIPAMLNDSYLSAQHIRSIVHDLKEFAGEQKKTELAPLDLNQAVPYALRFVKHDIAKTTDNFRLSLFHQPLYIRGDKLKLSQVIINIIENSLQSLESKAAGIVIRTDRITADGVPQQSRVLLEISDEGCGMSAEVLKNIYTPFYTTKRTSGGTGLGMAVVSGILREFEAEIKIDTEPDKGTRTRIWFTEIPQRPEF